MKTLYIETNHGFIKLADAGIVQGRYKQVVGTVVDSAQTSRLFHATSTREVYPRGSRQSHTIWREPYCTDKDADSWYVSTVTCG